MYQFNSFVYIYQICEMEQYKIAMSYEEKKRRKVENAVTVTFALHLQFT